MTAEAAVKPISVAQVLQFFLWISTELALLLSPMDPYGSIQYTFLIPRSFIHKLFLFVGSELSDLYQTIKPATLQESRLSMPESSLVQHTVVAVHGPAGDYYSEVVSGSADLTPVPHHKGSEGKGQFSCVP